MPVIPTYEPRISQTPTPRAVPPVEDPFTGVVRAIDTFERIQLAADTAEAQNQAQQAKAAISGAIQVSDADQQDPDVFKNTAINKVQSVYQSAIGGARNSRVRQMLQDRLNDDLTRASTAIHLTHKKKQVDVAQGNSFTYLQEAERELSQMTDPADIFDKEKEMAGHINDMIRFGAYSPLQGRQAIQGIKERDAFTRAWAAVNASNDPFATLRDLQKKLPNLDPAKLVPLMSKADERQRQFVQDMEKREREIREQAILNDTMIAVEGRLPREQLDRNARTMRYTAEQYRSILRAGEEGGVTNPDVYTRLLLEIRQGKLTDHAVVANNNQLDLNAKKELMGLISQAKDEKHFSKQPAYEQAAKLIRLAVSPKGQLETLDRVEQQRLKIAYDELWTRAGKGEDPIAVAKELDERIAREPTQGEKPMFKPRFSSKQALAEWYRQDPQNRKDQFDNEALLFRQWEQFNKTEAERAARPPSSSSQRRR
jgi:hypothetical protein